ncbi:MAG TPA: hypothetical protein VFJ51_10070 [Nitrososphaeraceae archaeon]|nr:hypothetical protein [Nitrososphaeraceae archaeon]
MEFNGAAPGEVAKVILKAGEVAKAFTSDNNEKPDLRYVVGSDATSVIEKRKSMSEREFSKYMSQNILG